MIRKVLTSSLAWVYTDTPKEEEEWGVHVVENLAPRTPKPLPWRFFLSGPMVMLPCTLAVILVRVILWWM